MDEHIKLTKAAIREAVRKVLEQRFKDTGTYYTMPDSYDNNIICEGIDFDR